MPIRFTENFIEDEAKKKKKKPSSYARESASDKSHI